MEKKSPPQSHYRRKLQKNVTLKPTTPKPAQSKENTTSKGKYVRRKPPCKHYNFFVKGGLEESFVVIETGNAHLSKHNVVIEGINPDLAPDVKTSMKNASYNNMSLGEDMQATNTCSKRKHNGAKPKDLPTLV
ncbi:hypothetical protein MtrunA17_Chr6g0485731 [Medicago truncatula]|uniref:Uncharacterized protein n=1 Tax=Medicago truncatula TaxID=3880 RepID=G7KPW2_MEDTR|nr:hypothetical protein MTR_6g088520 [Medicago truncatula]RHN52913.1 hypothetical protein MtrunA17_Chr6g0485731 [Medicago truncatula]